MTGASAGRRAAFPTAGCSSPPAPTCRRTASRSTSGHGAAVWKAGWSSMSSSTAARETKPAGRRSTRLLGRTWQMRVGDTTADLAARDRHRLRGAGRLCLGARRGLGPGRAGQGCRRLQPGEPGHRPDLCRCDRRAASGCGAVHGSGPSAVSTFKAETYRFLRLPRPTDEELGGRGQTPGRNRPSAGLGRERMVQAVRRRAAGHGARPGAASRGWNGRSFANATRRSTAGSTPAPPPGSSAPTAGRRRPGATSRRSSARTSLPSEPGTPAAATGRTTPESNEARASPPKAGAPAEDKEDPPEPLDGVTSTVPVKPVDHRHSNLPRAFDANGQDGVETACPLSTVLASSGQSRCASCPVQCLLSSPSQTFHLTC